MERAKRQFVSGKLAEAIVNCESAVKMTSDLPEAWSNMGSYLRAAKAFPIAEICAKRAFDLSPDNHVIVGNYANVLADIDDMDRAMSLYRRAIKINASDAVLRFNYISALLDFNQFDYALNEIERFKSGKLAHPKIDLLEGTVYLHQAKYQKGWVGFDRRDICPFGVSGMDISRNCKLSDLNGRHVVLFHDHGFGDTISYSRFVDPLMREANCSVSLIAPKNLHGVLRQITGVREVVDDVSSVAGPVDFVIPLMDVTKILNVSASSIAAPFPFKPSVDLKPVARQLISQASDKLKVGIVWSEGHAFRLNHKRSCSLDRFYPLARIPGVQLFSLQKGPRAKDIRAQGAGSVIWDLGVFIDDFSDTAALIDQMDLIIMVDSSVAHLAASMRKPVWNLLSYHSYWKYPAHLDYSPWYSSMKLFRQEVPGDWDGLFAKVEHNLKFFTYDNVSPTVN